MSDSEISIWTQTFLIKWAELLQIGFKLYSLTGLFCVQGKYWHLRWNISEISKVCAPVYCWTPVKACWSVSAAVGLWVEYDGRPLVYMASTGWPLGWWGIPLNPLTMGVTMLGTPEEPRLAGGELKPETDTKITDPRLASCWNWTSQAGITFNYCSFNDILLFQLTFPHWFYIVIDSMSECADSWYWFCTLWM